MGCANSAPAQDKGVSPEAVNLEFERKVSPYEHGVRTPRDSHILPKRALQKLSEGNQRYVTGKNNAKANFKGAHREALANYGQNPMAAIVGCADSRCPIEILFDVAPGDVFVLRNAGNTLSHAEGSIVGSVEYCVGPLGAQLIVVMGHTKCGAIMGATQTVLSKQKAAQDGTPAKQSTLEKLLVGLGPVVEQAQKNIGASKSVEELAAHAVKVNVFAGIERLLQYSESIRTKAKGGEVELHGAVYDIETGKVEFLGPHPKQADILKTMADQAVGA